MVKWSQECDYAMKLVSKSLINKRLGHCDCEKVLSLATDASTEGVSAVLSHDGKEVLIAFSLRT